MHFNLNIDDNIINATYGILDKKIDVTNILINISANNEIYIVSSNLFNNDPYFGKIKELIILYKSGEKVKIKDNNTIQFSSPITTIISNIAEPIEVEDIPVKIIKAVEKDVEIENTKPIININNNNIMHNKIMHMLGKSTNNYIISTNVRDESNILEWIIYHLLLGFDKVVIIDHKSIIPVSKLIMPYQWKHRVEVIRNETEGPVKMFFLNKIIIPYMKKNCRKYFIHLDGDEYIYIKNNKSIEELLKKYTNSNIIAINWLLFGSNNLIMNNNINKCLIPSYTRSDIKLNKHFKCFIRIDMMKDFSYVNPHHIILKNQPSIYTNVNNVNVQFNGNVTKHFDDMLPTNKCLDDLPCYLNHYIVQSKEDYMHRKINRNRDDIAAKRDINLDELLLYNNIINYNITSYNATIEYVFTNCCFNYGFIILRHVCSIATNNSWKECYNSIRKYYNNKIVVIDDNSDPSFLTEINIIDYTLIKSEFIKRGEILPYYYYIKNKFCERVIVVHDSMKFNQFYDFANIGNYNNFTRIFSFPNTSYTIDIGYFKEMCTFIKNGNLLYKYHMNNINNMFGCFGVCYVIDYNYLERIEERYNISNLVKYINTRAKRQTLERFLSCLFEMDKYNTKFKTRNDLFGSIFTNINNKTNCVIEKKFFGR